ncbi:MAG: hypothetical protein A2Y34_02435 [Spirochaetes bacterium GWC1_27_15]|nr:MAG: hypothetical protein A2Z98_15010 [Spirochaetes bacterium GWB1_27_13]OHD28224.1 MAG: hypothetical protein A2Y34_02435 [Spirochaetes bacterium GWC1_27_15]
MMEDFQLELEQTFLSESDEIITKLESDLLELEKNPEQKEIVNSVLRAAHTLKGSSGMIDAETLPKYIHSYETVLKSILNNPHRTKDAFNFLLGQVDYIKNLIDKIIRLKEPFDKEEYKQNIDKLANYEKNQEEPVINEKFGFFIEEKKEEKKLKEKIYYRITFKLQENRISRTWLPESIISDISGFGKVINITALPIKNINWYNFNIYQCYFYWIVLLESDFQKNEIEDIFLFFRQNPDNEIKIEVLTKDEITKVGEILITEGKLKKEELSKTMDEKKKIGEVLIEEHKIEEKDLNHALKSQEKLKKSLNVEEEIRISTKKIDWLIDLIGELIIANSNLSNIQKKIENLDLDQIQYNINKISRQMRDTILSLKMVPIGQLLTKYFRMIRDLSKEFGKEINLLLEGENTELDKSMFDILQEPLLHILRNSVDHGIETPQEREALGKTREGKVVIKSYHENGQIIIEIEDDGKGLDKEKILQKAIKKGLLKENIDYTDDEIYKIIFESGFSTKDSISLISGRGVGMDAVLNGIKRLNGNIRIKTEKGRGTTFIIQLPLTLAIIEGFLLRVGVNHFVIPLSFISECFEVNIKEMEQKNMVYNLRNEYLSLIKLDTFFENVSYDKNEFVTKKAVVLHLANGGKLGIIIDEIIGNIQAVIKPMAKIINKSLLITGSTLLGSGDVALILDVANLFEKFKDMK